MLQFWVSKMTKFQLNIETESTNACLLISRNNDTSQFNDNLDVSNEPTTAKIKSENEMVDAKKQQQQSDVVGKPKSNRNLHVKKKVYK